MIWVSKIMIFKLHHVLKIKIMISLSNIAL